MGFSLPVTVTCVEWYLGQRGMGESEDAVTGFCSLCRSVCLSGLVEGKRGSIVVGCDALSGCLFVCLAVGVFVVIRLVL